MSCFAHVKYNVSFSQLIDRGKVDAKDVALEIGLSPDTLTANLNVIVKFSWPV